MTCDTPLLGWEERSLETLGLERTPQTVSHLNNRILEREDLSWIDVILTTSNDSHGHVKAHTQIVPGAVRCHTIAALTGLMFDFSTILLKFWNSMNIWVVATFFKRFTF